MARCVRCAAAQRVTHHVCMVRRGHAARPLRDEIRRRDRRTEMAGEPACRRCTRCDLSLISTPVAPCEPRNACGSPRRVPRSSGRVIAFGWRRSPKRVRRKSVSCIPSSLTCQRRSPASHAKTALARKRARVETDSIRERAGRDFPTPHGAVGRATLRVVRASSQLHSRCTGPLAPLKIGDRTSWRTTRTSRWFKPVMPTL